MRKKNKPLDTRGKYSLVFDQRTDGTFRSPNLQIIWYDDAAGRLRSRSTGTACLEDAQRSLDSLYLSQEKGIAVCAACGQPIDAKRNYLLTEAIEFYLNAKGKKSSFSSIRPRLAHVLTYLTENNLLGTMCPEVDEDWIDDFREWMIDVPVEAGEGNTRERSPGTVEASVRQLAAAINFAKHKKNVVLGAQFSPKQPSEVSHTPTYRAPISMLGAMFVYCTQPTRKEGESEKAYAKKVAGRRQLLRFLQISVATWARPDAAHDVSVDPKRGQWNSAARTLNLNPRGRVQTRKHRPVVPVARQMALLLDKAEGFYVTVESVRQAFETMHGDLDLPGDREAGMNLIRRSMAQHARKRLDKRDWIEGKIMLGHHRPDVSDLYGSDEPGDLPEALRVTEEIIDEIIAIAPLAFESKESDAQ